MEYRDYTSIAQRGQGFFLGLRWRLVASNPRGMLAVGQACLRAGLVSRARQGLWERALGGNQFTSVTWMTGILFRDNFASVYIIATLIKRFSY